MDNYDYQSIWQEAIKMQPWKIVAICAVCGEKTISIIRFLALPETYSLARRCVDFAWSSVELGDLRIEEGEKLLTALQLTPEISCEYPDSLPFVVTHALSLSEFAVSAVTLASSTEKANNIGFSTVLDTADRFDLAIEQQEQDLQRNQSIVQAEKASQLSVMEILRRHNQPTQRILDELRREARSISSLFEASLPVYCSRYVTNLIRTARTSFKSRP